jgi:hypothetical protein
MQRAKQHGFFHLGAHLNSCSKSAAGLSSASTHRCLQDIRQICNFFPDHQFFAWLARMHGDVAEELGSRCEPRHRSRDRARRLSERGVAPVAGIIRAEYGGKKSSGSHTKTSW